MNKLEDLFKKSRSFIEYSDKYFKYIYSLFKTIDENELNMFLETILNAQQRKATIFILGNGGSATTATHYVNDLCKYASTGKKKTIKALSLTDNISWFSALANDVGYENVFVGQLENFLKKGDLVIGISASGNSQNIVKAFKYSNKIGANTLALVGFDGGKMKKIAQGSVYIRSNKGEYGPVEDIHMILGHLLSSFLAFSAERNNLVNKRRKK